jgi:hypothetical protein
MKNLLVIHSIKITEKEYEVKFGLNNADGIFTLRNKNKIKYFEFDAIGNLSQTSTLYQHIENTILSSLEPVQEALGGFETRIETLEGALENALEGIIETCVADGSITTAKLADNAVTNAKISSNAVTTTNIADLNVTAAKLASDSVTTVKIVDSNVTAVKLASDSVTTAKIVDSNVTAVKLASDSVTTAKIVDSNVTAVKLASDSVTTVKIVDSNVTAVKLASDSVTSVKLASDSVTTAKIVDSNITAAKLASDSVTTAKIVDSNITAAKLASDSVTTAKIVDSNVTAVKLASDSVTTAKIVDSNVTTAKLAATSVTAPKLGAITGDGLTGGAGSVITVDATVVRTSGDQTIDGGKTFNSAVVVQNQIGQQETGQSGFTSSKLYEVQTTSAASTPLIILTSTINTATYYDILISCFSNDAVDYGAFKLSCVHINDANTTYSLVGENIEIVVRSATLETAGSTVSAVGTTSSFVVNVVGAASTELRWNARVTNVITPKYA